MRYSPAHAAKSGSVPFMLRGPKPAKKILTAATAGLLGLGSTLFMTSPAMAAGALTVVATTSPVVEGSNLVFTVTNSGAALSGALTYGGTATPGTDFTAPSTPVAIAASGTTTITVPTIADNRYEGGTPETVVLTVTANVTDFGSATGTITDADTAPTYSLAATSPVTEAAGAKSTVTATLSKLSGVSSVITVNTTDGTAIHGTAPAGDYTQVSAGTITIPAGQTTGTLDIAINPDGIKDTLDTETFTVGGNATNVSGSATASVDVSIKDADAVPKLTLGGGGSGVEGGSGITFPITLDHGSELPITVQWDAGAPTTLQSGHNAATPGDDFPYGTTSQRTLTIAPGVTAYTPVLTVIPGNDSLNELPEDFSVSISNPVNATLGTTTKVDATINDVNTGLAPTVSVVAVDSTTEGNLGKSTKTFRATLSQKSGRTAKVDWATGADFLTTGTGHAVAGKDYVAANGTLTFPAGTLEQTFTVDVIGDTIDEGNAAPRSASDGETFRVFFTAPTGDTSVASSSPSTVKIIDDDLAPTIAIDDISMKEGDGPAAVLMPLKLTGSSDTALTFNVTDTTGTNTPVGTATAGVTTAPGGDDYDPIATTIVVQPESSVGYGVILVNGDTTFEKDETAYFTVTADSGGSAALVTDPDTKTLKLTLLNDDKVPDLEIVNVTGKEGDTVAVMGTVTGSSQEGGWVSVSFAGGSSNGSKAASADDFVNPGLQLVDISNYLPGTTFKVADLKLNTDTVAEPAETIIATGTGVNNSGTVTEGIITIAASNGGTTPPTDPPTDPTDPPTDPTDPPTDPTDEPPTLTSSSSFRLGVGTVTLSGEVKAGTEVQLWGRTVNSDDDAYEKIDETTASSSGRFSFKPALSTDGMYFKAMAGDLTSDPVKVNVKEDPDLTATSPAKGAVRLVVTGDPKIRGLGARVFRQNSNGSFTLVGSGILNANGTFTKNLTGLGSGRSYTYKAYVVGDGERGVLTNWGAYTRTVRVR